MCWLQERVSSGWRAPVCGTLMGKFCCWLRRVLPRVWGVEGRGWWWSLSTLLGPGVSAVFAVVASCGLMLAPALVGVGLGSPVF